MSESNYDKVNGLVRLYYNDPRMKLNVCSTEDHTSFAETPTFDEGFLCFEAANYDSLIAAFCTMCKQDETCSIHFDLRDSKDNTLYSAAVSRWAGSRFIVDIFPLGDQDPTLVGDLPQAMDDPALVKRIVDMSFGGFMSAEVACLGKDVDGIENRSEVQLYRAAAAQAKGELGLLTMLMNEHKPSLASQISQAEGKTKHLSNSNPKELDR